MLVLENVLHVDEEGMVNGVKDVLLQSDVFELVVLQDDILPDALHGVQVLVIDIFNQEDLAKRSLSNHLLHDEVFKLSVLLVLSHVV